MQKLLFQIKKINTCNVQRAVFLKVYTINVLLVKAFVPGLHLLIPPHINTAVFHSISRTVTLNCSWDKKKSTPSNRHLDTMMLAVEIHLEKELNQIRRQADEERAQPLQSQGRRAQRNSPESFPSAGCYLSAAARARLQQRIISWQRKVETVILITFARRSKVNKQQNTSTFSRTCFLFFFFCGHCKHSCIMCFISMMYI